MASLDELANQMPWVRKKFLKYHEYAQAQLKDLLSSEQLAQSHTKDVYTLASTYFENTGKGNFTAKVLPLEAQVSWTSGILTDDYNQDGKKDVLLMGNFYPWRVQLGKTDASTGVLLYGNGKGTFKSAEATSTGLQFGGDVRDAVSLMIGQKKSIVFSRNQGKIGIARRK